MYEYIVTALRTLNELLTAGIAITAFSLLLYALSFNLRERVARSFATILVCVVIVFVGEALGSVSVTGQQTALEFWLRFQWIGITLLPAAYLHFSDALLATTGKPSRGRRRLAVRLMYVISAAFLATLPLSSKSSPFALVGSLNIHTQSMPHLQRTTLTWVFTVFYVAAMLVAWINLWRAYQRTSASASRRRMTYLIAGAVAPAMGSFPYLLFGFGFAARHTLTFWMSVTITNLLVSVLLILMAYAVAFFGVPWPDRVVKRRLFKWLMRGPVTACTVLAITTILRRFSAWAGWDASAVIPVVMVASILIFEHLFTLIAPVWERVLFRGKDRADMELLQTLDERLLTLGDLRQFLEAILAAVCDRLQTRQAFLAAIGVPGDPQKLETLVVIGGEKSLETENLSENLLEAVAQNGYSKDENLASEPDKSHPSKNHSLFSWGEYWLAPIYTQVGASNGVKSTEQPSPDLIGLLGVLRRPGQTLEEEQIDALNILTRRAALALQDRRRQQQAFSSLEALTPQISMIQRLRAVASYDSAELLAAPPQDDIEIEYEDVSSWVKDALTHYWGGPKLTQSPLLELRVVQQAAKDHEENPTNALRAILRQAIDNVRPAGERRFTGEWILYNILEMKFMEGRKVREIAMRLAMSEADLYRKQRVALEAVANELVEMEKQARSEISEVD